MLNLLQTDGRNKVTELSLDAFVVKPRSPNEFTHCVRRLRTWRTAEREHRPVSPSDMRGRWPFHAHFRIRVENTLKLSWSGKQVLEEDE